MVLSLNYTTIRLKAEDEWDRVNWSMTNGLPRYILWKEYGAKDWAELSEELDAEVVEAIHEEVIKHIPQFLDRSGEYYEAGHDRQDADFC